ncbi:MAG: O-antigen translocase [Flavobacterium sp.]|uniref:O-antigen translocase n=1 Tax=Flavobacterium sp. TaxID=239 RepID=UPI0022CD104A|nr:O-antigen translocase [Flavobacterium sp.]MCZ8297428.1 O-antigen translocase [Flavobacterium sp.]
MKWRQYIKEHELWRITSLNSLSVLVRMGTGLISAKVVALCIGPTGMAWVGNLRNFITAVENIATLGMTNGIVKYTTEYRNDPNKQAAFINTVLTVLTAVALLTSLGIGSLAVLWNPMLLEGFTADTSLWWWIAAALPWYLVAIVLVAILNGLEAFREVVKIQTFGAILGLVATVGLVYYYATWGALLAVVVAPAVSFGLSAWALRNTLHRFQLRVQWSFIRDLSHYSLMALASSVVGPWVLILIRKKLIAFHGLEQAGYWEALNRLSGFYFVFVTTLIGLYFLPKLVQSESRTDDREVFRAYYGKIIPLFGLGLLLIYLLRNPLITFLYTDEFQTITAVLIWQLLGDFCKALALLLGYRFFAKRQTFQFLITEMGSLALLYFLCSLWIPSYGLLGLLYAYTLNYAVYFLLLVLLYRFRQSQ